MIARLLRAAALAVLTLLPALLSPAGAQPAPFRALRAEPDAWEAGTWARYKDKFLKPEGRIIDDANGNISHSEGQGYGMLLAVLADDKAAFSSLWAWTQKNLMKRPDGLVSWKWEADKTPNITDANNASDGELLIAWALVEAADRWSTPEYRDAAQKMVIALDKAVGARSGFGRVLLPGADGFAAKDREDGPVVNPSYWIFPALERLKPIAPSIDWDGYRASGYTLLRATRFGNANLATDWVSITGGKARPADGFPPRFSYNAVRIPLYLAWAEKPNTEALQPYVNYGTQMGEAIAEYDVTSSRPAEAMGAKGYAAIFAVAKCALDGSKLPLGLRSVSLDQYYPTTLHMLALAAVRLRLGKCW